MGNANLIMRFPDGTAATVPLGDIAVVVASTPQIIFTHAALAGILSSGGATIVCDHPHLPEGMLLLLPGNLVQGERIARQLAAKLPIRRRLWKQVVRCKLDGQSSTLTALNH